MGKENKKYWLGSGSLGGQVKTGQEIPDSVLSKMDKKRIEQLEKEGLIGEIAKRIEPAQNLESTDKKIQKAMIDMKEHIEKLEEKIVGLEEKNSELKSVNLDLKKRLEDLEIENSLLKESIEIPKDGDN